MKDKIIEKFDAASNTTQMVKDFIAIIKSKEVKGNIENIKECFKGVTEYCYSESYFDTIKDSIARQIDTDMLDISGQVESIEDLF